MLLTHTLPFLYIHSFDCFDYLRPSADRTLELNLNVRRALNSKLLAASALVIVGGFFTMLFVNHGSLASRFGIVVLHLGLFVSLVAAAFCFNLAGFNVTWVSYAMFNVWAGLVVMSFFEYGWRHAVIATILYLPYFQIGRLLAALYYQVLITSVISR
jgi:hypothetical protein